MSFFRAEQKFPKCWNHTWRSSKGILTQGFILQERGGAARQRAGYSGMTVTVWNNTLKTWLVLNAFSVRVVKDALALPCVVLRSVQVLHHAVEEKSLFIRGENTRETREVRGKEKKKKEYKGTRRGNANNPTETWWTETIAQRPRHSLLDAW